MPPFFSKTGGFMDWLLRRVPVAFAQAGLLLARYENSEGRRDRLKRIRRIRSERDMLLIPAEACQIICALKAIEKIPGDMAEVGVSTGGSAKMISDCAPNRTLHLFDTFEGLPAPHSLDSPRFKPGQYASDFENVREYLRTSNVKFYKGYFPATTKDVPDVRFAFVHLDADLYESTKAGLEWFYPRMSAGAILICHDFVTSEGVNRAFQEFFEDKPEAYIELTGSQCMFVKQRDPN
jgi:predicted O-methyltransferase YrrM